MKFKKGDPVIVITGKDKGKKGKIMQSFPEEDRVVVEGVNKMLRHVKPKREGEKGQRVEFNAPIHISNVMFLCPKCNKPSRIGYKYLTNKKKNRICKKCGEIFS